MAPIEIDDFPSDRNLHLWLGFSSSLTVSHNQMVYIYIYIHNNRYISVKLLHRRRWLGRWRPGHQQRVVRRWSCFGISWAESWDFNGIQFLFGISMDSKRVIFWGGISFHGISCLFIGIQFIYRDFISLGFLAF